MSDSKWYMHSSSWSAIAAVLAIFLSQTAPIATWFPKRELVVQYGDRMHLNNSLGRIGYNLPIHIENSGNTELNIIGMDLTITNEKGEHQTYSAATYKDVIAGDIAITSVRLKPDEIWGEYVFFNQRPTTEKEDKINQIRLNISQSILDSSADVNFEDAFKLHTADPELVKEAKDFFDENFDLEKGEYQLKWR